MKKKHLSLLLLFLPWVVSSLVSFFGGYLGDGTNEASLNSLLISVVCGLVGVLVVSVYLAAKLATGALHRIVVSLLLIAGTCTCTFILPAPARVCVWGQALRLRHEIPMQLLQSTAVDIKRKRDKRILRTIGPEGRPSLEGDTFVDKSELPDALRDRIEYVKFNSQFLCFTVNRRVGILYPLVPVYQRKDLYRIADDLYLSVP